ncbi:glutaminase [Gracilaria domingensis]|nr:glutaminase [Gracilaria domingensis]
MSLSSILEVLKLECSNEEVLLGLGGASSHITVNQVKRAIQQAGIVVENNRPDPRVRDVLKALEQYDSDHQLPADQFIAGASDNLTLLHRIATKEMAIRDFTEFKRHIDDLKASVAPIDAGENADYIPILKHASPDKFGVAFCSVDGQFHESGHTRELFSVQSTCKPIMFALALEKLGQEKIMDWCGIEPSGRPFNDMTLMNDERPFNPMVNSGALMISGLLAAAFPDIVKEDGPYGEDKTYAQKLCMDILIPVWRRLAAAGVFEQLEIDFSEETFLSERRTADRNTAITYNMKARKGLPPNVDTQYMIDFYLRSCSIMANSAAMSVVAATLANGGKNPITGDQVFDGDVVKKMLSVLSLCGFYDNSGEFFFDTGIPSKSGVSGIVMMVLPNIGGFATFSPRLDKYGNSVRGSLFAKELVRLFTFHTFDNLSALSTGCRLDPRFSCDASRQRDMSRLRWAVKANGKQALKFDKLLVNTCIRIALANGAFGPREQEVIKLSYKAMMHLELCQARMDEIRKDIAISHDGGLEGLFNHVRSEAQYLRDTEKELMLAAAVKVATADGNVSSAEERMLEILAEALHIQKSVLHFRLKGWKRECKVCKDT